MRAAFIIVIALIAIPIALVAISSARAETPARPGAQRPASPAKVLPLKGASGANSCAAYGAGFVRVEGSCIKVGGSIDVGVAASSRR